MAVAFLSELLWHGRVEIKESEKDAPRPEIRKERTTEKANLYSVG